MRFHGYFYPRPPRGGRRSAPLFRPSSRNYFYPRPPRGGRRQARSGRQVAQDISIHALREEGDLGSPWVSVGFSEFLSTPSARRATDTFLIFCRQMQISIHALREEGDWVGGRHRRRPRSFLSTPSARRATSSACRPADAGRHFYPRPPRGGRPGGMPNPRAVKEISIHALREEGDHRSLFRSAQKIDFYPRPPRGGRPTSSLPSWRGGNFYPRPPRGGRQAYKTDGWVGLAFLSTPSARRATWPAHRGRRQIPISIHALREEGDVARCGDSVGNRRFLSTPSARRATV